MGATFSLGRQNSKTELETASKMAKSYRVSNKPAGVSKKIKECKCGRVSNVVNSLEKYKRALRSFQKSSSRLEELVQVN